MLKKTTLKVKNNYIARCDADDISLKNRFRDQINFLKKNKHIDVLSSNIIELNKNKKQIKKVPKLHEDIKKKIYFRNPINHSSVIIKKKILIKAGNYEEVNYFEDYFLWFKIINCGGKFHNIQKNHVIMNVDKDYYQRRSGLKYYLDYLYLLKKVRKKKIINNIQYILNIIIRFLVILTPIFFLSKVYKIFLRN